MLIEAGTANSDTATQTQEPADHAPTGFSIVSSFV